MLTEQTVAHEFAHYFSEKNAEKIGELLHEDFRLYDPALKWVYGRRAVVKILAEQFAQTEIVEYTIAHILLTESTIVLEFKITLDALTLYGVDLIEMEDGKMKELRCYYNPIGSLGPHFDK